MSETDRDRLRGVSKTLARLLDSTLAFAAEVDRMADSRTYVGCGTSLDIPQAVLALAAPTTTARAVSAGATIARPVQPRLPGHLVAVSRSGKTAELIEVSQREQCFSAITCEPDSPLAASARYVLDLSVARDQGDVAWASSIATLWAVAIVEAPPRERSKVAETLIEVAATALPDAHSAKSIAWLLPLRVAPLGRELVRKTVESGRTASYAAEPLEFLHGEHLPYLRESAVWLVMDTERSIATFERYVAKHDVKAKVMTHAFDWTSAQPGTIMSALLTAYGRLLPNAASVT